MTTTQPAALPERRIPDDLLHLCESEREAVRRYANSYALAALQPQPAAAVSDESAYNLIDRFLRNNLHDDDYAEYSQALDILALRPQAVPMTDAARDVLVERQRQVNTEGWTPEHDDKHDDGSMATAAAAYAIASLENNHSLASASELFSWTGWAKSWWKPSSPRRDLIKAGALILAEIERLDRAHGITAQGAQGEQA